MIHNSKIAFFGSSEFSVHVLDELKLHNITPALVITTPDKPKGRKLIPTPTPVKIWARENGIEVLDPEKLKGNSELVSRLKSLDMDIFLVASYGKIIPPEIFNIPERKTLNIHPSLLPKYRGASPIQSQILNAEKEVGVSIMQIDEGMDTGPVVTQRQFPIFNFQLSNSDSINQFSIPGRKELEEGLAIEGARLFAHILPEWLAGAIDPIMQNENEATYCEKIEKQDGELKIDLRDLPTGATAREALLKIKAFQDWPTAYTFFGDKRIIITDAALDESGALKLLRVKPEGKNEMPFGDFLRGLH